MYSYWTEEKKKEKNESYYFSASILFQLWSHPDWFARYMLDRAKGRETSTMDLTLLMGNRFKEILDHGWEEKEDEGGKRMKKNNNRKKIE